MGDGTVRVPATERAQVWLDGAPPLPEDGIGRVLAAQRADGSWGDADDVRRRVLPTLWTVSLLGDLGLGGTDAWHAGAELLARRATTDDGTFSRDGRREGVLACYVSIAATTFLLGGRRDLAAPQVAWLLRHQDVRDHGASRRPEVTTYHPALATRYGGCFAGTTCLIGVVKAGRALEMWSRDPAVSAGTVSGGTVSAGPSFSACGEALTAIRDALLDRHLMFRRDGGVVPLGTAPTRAHEWLLPTFPLDWRTDLVEVLDVVARTGPADQRMQPALDHVASLQLPDGGWPLLRSFWPRGVPALEPRTGRRPSRAVTERVVAAVEAVRTAGRVP